MSDQQLRDVKRTNVFGSPIYKDANDKCPFVHYEKSKFPVCVAPCRDYYRKSHSYGSIISCSNEYTDCCLYVEQNKLDVIIIGNYINKFSDGGWINVSDDHWIRLRDEKIVGNHTDEYLASLFEFYGWYEVSDEHADGKILTNQKTSSRVSEAV